MLLKYAAGSTAGSGALGSGTSGIGISAILFKPLLRPGDFNERVVDVRSVFVYNCPAFSSLCVEALEAFRLKRPMFSNGRSCAYRLQRRRWSVCRVPRLSLLEGSNHGLIGPLRCRSLISMLKRTEQKGEDGRSLEQPARKKVRLTK